MARPDNDPRRALRDDEGDLAAFFEAARTEPRTLPPAFLTAVLADAADVTAGRAPAPPPARSRRLASLAALLRPLGGWAGATALAGCLAAGFLVGVRSDGADTLTAALWPDRAAFATLGLDAPLDGVDGFFDLTAGES